MKKTSVVPMNARESGLVISVKNDIPKWRSVKTIFKVVKLLNFQLLQLLPLVLLTICSSLIIVFIVTSTQNFKTTVFQEVVSRVEDNIDNYFNEKLNIIRSQKRLIESSDINENTTIYEYERLLLNNFKCDSEYLALYFAKFDHQTWKFHRESNPYISTQIRTYINSTYSYRYDFVRKYNDSLNEYNITEPIEKLYDPYKNSWFQDAIDVYPDFTIQGPELTSSNEIGHEENDVVLLVICQKIQWKNPSQFSVSKLKFDIRSLASLLKENDLGNKGDIAISKYNGEIVSYRNINESLKVINTEEGKKKLEIKKIWEIENFQMSKSQFFNRTKQDTYYKSIRDGEYLIIIILNEKNLMGLLYYFYVVIVILLVTTLATLVILIFIGVISMFKARASLKNESKIEILNQLLPPYFAKRLIKGERIIRVYNNVSILFADIVGFGKLCVELNVLELSSFLQYLFSSIDIAVVKNCCITVKDIGDAKLSLCGCPIPNNLHAYNILNLAFDIIEIVKNQNVLNGREIQMRIGCHSGSIIAGVVSMLLDTWGVDINKTARLEALSRPNCVHVSEPLRKNMLVLSKQQRDSTFRFTEGLQDIELKRGERYDMKTYFVSRLEKKKK